MTFAVYMKTREVFSSPTLLKTRVHQYLRLCTEATGSRQPVSWFVPQDAASATRSLGLMENDLLLRCIGHSTIVSLRKDGASSVRSPSLYCACPDVSMARLNIWTGDIINTEASGNEPRRRNST